jgi:hypothetical protein
MRNFKTVLPIAAALVFLFSALTFAADQPSGLQKMAGNKVYYGKLYKITKKGEVTILHVGGQTFYIKEQKPSLEKRARNLLYQEAQIIYNPKGHTVINIFAKPKLEPS